jgi:hypothetical protein
MKSQITTIELEVTDEHQWEILDAGLHDPSIQNLPFTEKKAGPLKRIYTLAGNIRIHYLSDLLVKLLSGSGKTYTFPINTNKSV